MESALISVGGGIILFALGFLVSVMTGESRAKVSKLEAETAHEKAAAELDFAQLAREAAKDLKTLREEYETDREKKDKEIKELQESYRINKQEKEKELKEIQSRVRYLEEEKILLQRQVNEQNRKLEDQAEGIRTLTRQLEELNQPPKYTKPKTGPFPENH